MFFLLRKYLPDAFKEKCKYFEVYMKAVFRGVYRKIFCSFPHHAGCDGSISDAKLNMTEIAARTSVVLMTVYVLCRDS